jgi:hypothetical protein
VEGRAEGGTRSFVAPVRAIRCPLNLRGPIRTTSQCQRMPARAAGLLQELLQKTAPFKLRKLLGGSSLKVRRGYGLPDGVRLRGGRADDHPQHTLPCFEPCFGLLDKGAAAGLVAPH